MSSPPGTLVRLDAQAVTSPRDVVETEPPPRRRLDEESAREQRQARRPGPAGAAAAERLRLANELEGLQKALALTRRMLGGEATASSSVEETRPPAISPFVSASRVDGLPRRSPPSASPARVLRLPA